MYMFPNPAPERARRNPPTDIFLPIIGSIYPIQTYKLYWYFTNQIQTYMLQNFDKSILCWIYASDIWRIHFSWISVIEHILPTIGGIYVIWRVSFPGPNCPGPNCPGAQLSGAQLSALTKWTIGPRTVGPPDSWAPDSWAPGKKPSKWHISPQ